MKSALETRFGAQRESAAALVAAEHGDEALEIICSFSNLECVADVKLEDGWVRYLLIEGGEGENDDVLRRI